MARIGTQEIEIVRAFSRRRRNQLLLAGALAPIIFAAVLYQRHTAMTILGMPPRVGAPIFLALVVGGLSFSLWNWRCPACSRYLGRAINPRNCPSCGVRLRG
jgi:hypothetical protein